MPRSTRPRSRDDDDIDVLNARADTGPTEKLLSDANKTVETSLSIPREMLVQCSAVRRSGKRCEASAEFGSHLCRFHGGGTQFKRAEAKKALLQCVGPALQVLSEAMQQADWPTAVKAAQIVLDRAGFGPQAKLDISDKRTDDLERLTDQELERRALMLANIMRDKQAVEKQRAVIDAEVMRSEEVTH